MFVRPDNPGMSQDPPAHPDRRVYDLYIAGRQSAALAAAVRAGLFDALEARPRPAEALARELGLARRPVTLLCRALLAMGYPQGPLLGEILTALETAQLEEQVADEKAARRWVRERFPVGEDGTAAPDGGAPAAQ